ncbi:phage antirepressor KilAC domain-containing protein [Paenibacillus chitinolyticus]|uniref:Phage antirepressor KilAC domain-containing protein n=1 Tax=Paenibacillus chitinolyticus TaxID=79263 RepID=A0ABT4FMK0_9BACL|nr:phage antirepressor KilAC domain-containing protein [Paenibacillus chitinolyticus]MCY9594152.1 phage antirepressor KilAC domain-containing protein [Paenibacillus chitinolyticus]MCY9599121.1 phage antirepressor KilAC domain-containing protein [Paenibacillus chitinolyticus]
MTEKTNVREIEFHGTKLLCVQSEDKKIWVGVSFICNGIGLSEGQRDRQVKNLQDDVLLKRGCKKLPVKFDGQVRETLIIDIDYLPLWLAKISITPSMLSRNPELVTKLIEYQLKAKDVLAQAFIYKKTEYHIPDTYAEALRLAAEVQFQLEIAQPKAEKYDEFLNSDGLIQLNEVAKHLKIGLKTFYAILRTEGILMKQKKPNVHIPTAKYANKGYFSIVREQVPNKDSKMVWHSVAYATHSGFDFLNKFISAYIQEETA